MPLPAQTQATARIVKPFILPGLLLGLITITLVAVVRNAGAVWHGVTALGWGGFAAITLFHLALIAVMGAAWWILGQNRGRPWQFAWGRLIRDSAAEILPLSQLGGYVLGGRAAAMTGLPGTFAAGSTVVDVTMELAAQLVYTLLGLALLSYLRPGSGLVLPLLGAVGGMSVLVALFLVLQARGAKATDHTTGRIRASLSQHLLGRALAGSGAVQADIQELYARPARLLQASTLHCICWILSGLETWLTLWLMHVSLPVASGITIDSLLYGLRSLAFMVPNAVGVQEGGLIFLCGLFGIGAETALALSLIKRARDLVIGIPALLLWQALEGERAWGRRAAAPVDEAVPDKPSAGNQPL